MKIKKICSAILAGLCAFLLQTKPAFVQAPPGPATPTTDFLESAQAYSELAAKKTDEYATMAENIQTKTSGQIQALKENVNDQISSLKLENSSSLIKKKDEPNIAVAREDEFGADETSEEAIAEKFKKLFLRYPVDIMKKYPRDKEIVQNAYKNKGLIFSNDSLLEMFLVVRKLEERMTELKKEFDELSACYVQGETKSDSPLCSSSEDTDVSQGIWGNYAKMTIIYDQMLQITTELYAIRAQYEVAYAIRSGVNPLDESMQTETSADTSNKSEDKSADAGDVMHYRQVITSAQAQVMPEARKTVSVSEALKQVKTQTSSESVKAPTTPKATLSTLAVQKSGQTATSSNVSTNKVSAKNVMKQVKTQTSSESVKAPTTPKATLSTLAVQKSDQTATSSNVSTNKVSAKNLIEQFKKQTSSESAKAPTTQKATLTAVAVQKSGQTATSSNVLSNELQPVISGEAADGLTQTQTSSESAKAPTTQKAMLTAVAVQEDGQTAASSNVLSNELQPVISVETADGLTKVQELQSDVQGEQDLSVQANVEDTFTDEDSTQDEQEQNDVPLTKYSIVKAKPSIIHTSLSGKDQQFVDLATATNAYNQVSLARNLHNLSQQLPTMRESFIQYRNVKKMHEKAIEKLRDAESFVADYLSKYYDAPEKVLLGDDCHYDITEDSYIICKTDRYVTSESLSSLEKDDILCPDNNAMICKKFGIHEYGKRGGFAGWLISAYKTAKAEKAVEINEEDYATGIIDLDQTTELDDFNDSKNLAQQGLEQLEVSDSIWSKPSRGEEIYAELREVDLIGWQIGAEGAKALGNDMVSNQPKWGKVTNAYPLWMDEKLFYKQYVDAKYENMKSFIQQLDMTKAIIEAAQKVTDSLVGESGTGLIMGISADQAKQFNNEVLSLTQQLYEQKISEQQTDEDQEDTSIDASKRENDSELQKLRAAHERKLSQLENTKDKIYEQLDQLNIDLKEHKTNYNNTVISEKTAEESTQNQKNAIAKLFERKKVSKHVVTSSFEQRAETAISDDQKTKTQVSEQQDSLDVKIENDRDAIDVKNTELEENLTKKKQAKSDYVLAASALEHENIYGVRAAQDALDIQGGQMLLADNESFKEALEQVKGNSIQKEILSMVVSLVDNYASQAKEQMIEEIDETYAEIQEMDDDVVNPDKYEELVSVHQTLIEKLNSISTLEEISALLPIVNTSAIVSPIYTAYLKDAICGDGLCHTTDNDYFVGLPPKSRDFTAPTKIAQTYTPPLREIVHFDIADYDELAKSNDGENKTTRYDFLNYGQDLPDIWKRILGTNGFVERDVDVEKILTHNQDSKAVLFRGGTFPCAVGSHHIDIKDGKMLYVYPSNEKAPVCQGIKSASLYANGIANVLFDNGDRAMGTIIDKKLDRHPSELSLLLQYKDGVALSDGINEISEFFISLKQEDADEDEYGYQVRLYENALLNRNQFGDYLTFVEIESIYQNSIDKLEVSLAEIREKINAKLQPLGYDLGDDYDLADEDTYNNLMEKLVSHKNKVVNYSVNEVNDIKTNDNFIDEKKTKLKSIVQMMQKDKENLVQISDNTDSGTAFSEQVKRKTVDKEVLGKFKEEVDKSLQDNLDGFKVPYLAVYE